MYRVNYSTSISLHVCVTPVVVCAQECGEWQVQLERALREKKAVEKELERAFAQGPLQHSQTGEALHELQSRVCAAERARDDALLQLENEVALRKRAESRSVGSIPQIRCLLIRLITFALHAACWRRSVRVNS